ncbi:MAG TPA: hypothetical protein VGJ69_12110, partial [Pyrinomonadaceae bacterium]
MIVAMPNDLSLKLETRILDLPNRAPSRIGPLTAKKLALGVAEVSLGKDINNVTIEDLLLYLPMRYEDRSNLTRIRDLEDGMEASLELFVKLSGGHPIRSRRRSYRQRLFVFKISATDRERSGKDVLIWTFLSGPHAPTIIENYTKKFSRGVRFIAFGRWKWDAPDGTFALQLHKPDEIEVLPVTEPRQAGIASGLSEGQEESGDPSLSAIHVGRCVPVYRKLNDIRPKQLREIIHRVLAALSDEAISENLPGELRQRQKLIARADALREIHFPPEEALLADYERGRSPAHRRLIFEELFWLALALCVKRGHRSKENKSAVIKIDDAIKKRIASVLPFKLTEAQRKVVQEIFRDMKSNAPMNRLLQGDVGSGKTIVALISMLAAMENGYQTALMV